MISSRTELTQVVQHSLVLRASADLLERWDRHRSQEADDDNNDHDFYERKALGGFDVSHVDVFFNNNIRPKTRQEQVDQAVDGVPASAIPQITCSLIIQNFGVFSSN